MLHIEESTSTRGGRGHTPAPWAPEEDWMKGTIAIVAPEGANLEGLLEFAPDDVEVKRIDSSQPVEVKAEQMSDAAALVQRRSAVRHGAGAPMPPVEADPVDQRRRRWTTTSSHWPR